MPIPIWIRQNYADPTGSGSTTLGISIGGNAYKLSQIEQKECSILYVQFSFVLYCKSHALE
jgi:hypothetical protein